MNDATNKIPFHILLVEDNAAEAMLAKLAITEIEMECILKRMPDGEEALAYLDKLKAENPSAFPDLILLDLNLPKKSGKQVLMEIKTDAVLRHIPVVILSSSQSHQDIQDCYNLYANCYIIKPLLFDDFIKDLYAVIHFWNGTVKLPCSA